MAGKNNFQGVKPNDPNKVNELSQAFSNLSEQDKGIFLRRCGIFFLQNNWRPLNPTPELRPVLNQLSRLVFLVDMMMRNVAMRRIDVKELEVISEDSVDQEVARPCIKVMRDFGKKIEKVLRQNQNQNKGGGNGSNEEQSSTETSKKDEKATEEDIS